MHKQTQKKIAMATILAVPTFALAQATPVGPFTGEFSDSFEGLPGGFIGSGQTARIFDDTADIGAGPSGNMLVFGGWSFRCVINPFDGGQGVGSASQPGEYTFDEGAVAFGGYFGSNADTSGVDGTIRFFDEDDNDSFGSGSGDAIGEWDGDDVNEPIAACAVREDTNAFGATAECFPVTTAQMYNLTGISNDPSKMGFTPVEPNSQNRGLRMRNGFAGSLLNSLPMGFYSAATIVDAILDDASPLRVGCDALSQGALEAWRTTSDQELLESFVASFGG